ncbi:MAG: Wzz/FepE/Etk N-terminal domain-containing protein [Candidatus Acidiferrales bacterium]
MDEITIRPSDSPRPIDITLRDAVSPLFRQRRLAGLLFLGIFLGAVLAGLLLPRKYQSEMTILVNRERVDPVVTPDADPAAGAIPQPAVSEEDLNSEVELIKSRDLLENVVLACGLNSVPDSQWQRGMRRVSNFLHGSRTTPETRLARSVQTLQSQLIVEPLKKTTLIRVTYTSRDPALAARVLQTLGTLYQEKHAAVHRPAGTFGFFDQEATRYREELAGAESQLIHFDNSSGLVDAVAQKTLVLQQLSQFESELNQAQASAAGASERAIALKAQAAATPARETTAVEKLDNAQLLADLQSSLLSLELKHSEMIGKYSPSYPPMQQLEAQIADARAALTRAQASPMEQVTTDRVPAQDWLTTELAKAETDRAALDAEAAAKAGVVKRYQAMARTLDAQGAQQADLLRDVKTAEGNYLLYLRKREDARILDALDRQRIVNVSVAEAATVPALPTLKLGWLLMGGFFTAGTFSVGAAYAADRLDPHFRTPRELQRYLDMKVLASIPSSTMRP